MIKDLRRRIVAISVITASVILFAAIVLIFSLGYARITAERENRLRSALTHSDEVGDESGAGHLFDDVILVTYNLSTGEFENWQVGSKVDFPVEDLAPHVRRIVDSYEDSGVYVGQLVYVKVREGDVVKIAMNSLYNKGNGLTFYFFGTLGALLLGLGCFVVISILVARMALKPVEDSWKKQKQFVADASHELKTPLSVIMANTDIIASHPDETVQSQMRWIENTRTEAERMAGLVADLLFLAKNDDGLRVQMETMSLSECIGTVVLGHEALFYENNKQFSYEVEPSVVVEGNEAQLKQLITILLDNADKYSSGEGNVKINLSTSMRNAYVEVSNDCEPLTDEQLEHLFDRFYTVDQSRNKNNGGNGLGLAIAKTVCETHHGTIKAEYENGRIIFTATLPLKRKNH